MGWYRLPWPKALIAFIIDVIGYTISGPFIFIRSIFLRKVCPSSIFLLRLDHMGDVLMAVPAITAIRRRFPYAHITVGVRKQNYALLSLPGVIDDIVTLDVPWAESSPTTYGQWCILLKKIMELKRKRFDMSIDFKGDIRNIFLIFLIRSRERISYGIRGGGFLLTGIVRFLPGPRHEVERNMDIVRYLGGRTVDSAPHYEVPLENMEKVEKSLAGQVCGKERLIGIHPGANSRSKIWPPLYFARLADRIEEELGDVVIFGGPEEKEILKEIRRCLHTRPLIIEGLSLEELAAFFKKLDIFIGNDSGPFHLAEAVGTEVIVIFGSTYPELVGPVTRNSTVIKSRRPCAPCRRPGEKEKCKTYECLRDISVDEIFNVVQSKLKG